MAMAMFSIMSGLQLGTAAGRGGGGGGTALFIVLLELAVTVLMIASLWVIFTKAGRPGWASIIPIYNLLVMLDIAGKPMWWIILFFVPFVNFVVVILVTLALAERFGKGVGFALGMLVLPFVFFPLLAFGDAQYLG